MLSNEEKLEQCDFSAQENEYAEALKKLQFATEQVISFSRTPLACVKKSDLVHNDAIDLIETEIERMTTFFNDMADKVTKNTPLSEVTTTHLLSSAQNTLPKKVSNDPDQLHTSTMSTATSDSVAHFNESQPSQIPKSKSTTEVADTNKISTAAGSVHNKRKVDSVTPDDNTEKLKKGRLAEDSIIAIKDTATITTTVASPFSKSSIVAKGPTFNANAFSTSTITLPTTTSFPPVAAVVKIVKPASAIQQPVVHSEAPSNLNAVTDAPTPLKNLANLPATSLPFSELTKPKTVKLTDTPQLSALQLKEYASKMEPTGSAFGFIGRALKDDMGYKFGLVFDACKVHNYVERVESDFETADLDIDLFWPKYIYDCMSKEEESKSPLCAWIEENLDPRLSWILAKGIILLGLGVYAPSVIDATTSVVHSFQATVDTFADYRLRYQYIAQAVILLNSVCLADSTYSTESKLIDCFIQGTRYLKSYLTELRDSGVASETWNDFRLKMDQKSEEIEFIDMKGRCDQDLACEEERAQYDEIVKRKARKAKMKAKAKAKKEAKRVQQLQKNSAILMEQRKEEGLCSFCGVVKHSFKHFRVCDAKKKYLANGKILPN